MQFFFYFFFSLYDCYITLVQTQKTKQIWIEKKRERRFTAEETLQLLQDMSEGGSDGGDVSGFSDEDWVDDKGSDSELEPSQKKNKRSVTLTLTQLLALQCPRQVWRVTTLTSFCKNE